MGIRFTHVSVQRAITFKLCSQFIVLLRFYYLNEVLIHRADISKRYNLLAFNHLYIKK